MTQEAQREKNYFQFNRGINTEQSELLLEDGFSADEANYELLTDGSRRRRRGLRQEASGGTVTVNSFNPSTDTSQAFKWRNAGGEPDKNFIVHKVGSTLYFTDDSDGGSASVRTESFDLDDYRVNNTGDVDILAADFSQGRGYLFVATELTYPLWITYDAANDTFNDGTIKVQIRDYQDIEDGIPLDQEPASGRAGAATAAQLASDFPDHRYNMLNRGWTDDRLVQYENDIVGNTYPAKVHSLIQAYELVADRSVAASTEMEGTYSWDATKLNAHPHTGSSAPKGSMLLSIFNDTVGFKEVTVDGTGTTVAYTTGAASYAAGPPETLTATDIVYSDPGTGTWTVTVAEAGHSVVLGQSIRWVSGLTPDIIKTSGSWSYRAFTCPEIVTVSAVNAGTDWSFEVTGNGLDFSTGGYSIQTAPERYGYTPVARSSGNGPATTAPRAIEFHAGRLWFAGMPDTEFADYIFYSQVVQKERNYNRCHTEADPTGWNFNSPVITDGGFLIVPNIGNVKKLLSLQDSLLVFSDQGIWEVRGQGTFFDPSNYVIRKITDAECGSAYAPILVEGVCVYTSPKGVYMIAPDQYTRQLTATNISDDRIREQWLAITPTYEPYIKTVYDDADKRLYFLQPGTANMSTSHITYTVGDDPSEAAIGQCSVVWIYDLRVGAWYKYTFNQNTQANAIIHAFSLTGQDNASGRKKLKFAVQKSATTFIVCDFSESSGTGFQDFDGNTVASFVLSHYEGLNAHAHRKQAPIVTVYSKRTTTGYTATGNGLSAVNPSSTTMTAYWDWTDDAISKKIGTAQEVYRDVRGFVPSGATDVDGYPVVVTRNKVRGRGRVLQLKFAASTDASGEDSHILGYTVNYKVSRRK